MTVVDLNPQVDVTREYDVFEVAIRDYQGYDRLDSFSVSAVGGVTQEMVESYAVYRVLVLKDGEPRRGGTTWRMRRWHVAEVVAGRFKSLAYLLERFQRESFLYVVQAGDLVKIGRSHRPSTRLTEHQVSSPVPLVEIAVVPEWVVLEEEAHELWDRDRSHGEWFHFTEDLQRWVNRLPEKHRELIPLKRRCDELVRRRLSPIRRLSSLVATEEKVLSRRREKEQAERERREKAKGCVLCGDTGRLQSNRHLPGFFCQSCRMFTYRYAKKGAARMRRGYELAVRKAEERLQEHDQRVDALEEYVERFELEGWRP